MPIPNKRLPAPLMADLDAVYSTYILDLAANIPRCERLAHPQATATAQSRLCGSTVTIDLVVENNRVAGFGQTVRACLLGQASASIMGREIVGTTSDELREVATLMRRMLKDNGPPPVGRWADLAVLEPVRDYPQRHASTLLVFDAVEKALDSLNA